MKFNIFLFIAFIVHGVLMLGLSFKKIPLFFHTAPAKKTVLPLEQLPPDLWRQIAHPLMEHLPHGKEQKDFYHYRLATKFIYQAVSDDPKINTWMQENPDLRYEDFYAVGKTRSCVIQENKQLRCWNHEHATASDYAALGALSHIKYWTNEMDIFDAFTEKKKLLTLDWRRTRWHDFIQTLVFSSTDTEHAFCYYDFFKLPDLMATPLYPQQMIRTPISHISLPEGKQQRHQMVMCSIKKIDHHIQCFQSNRYASSLLPSLPAPNALLMPPIPLQSIVLHSSTTDYNPNHTLYALGEKDALVHHWPLDGDPHHMKTLTALGPMAYINVNPFEEPVYLYGIRRTYDPTTHHHARCWNIIPDTACRIPKALGPITAIQFHPTHQSFCALRKTDDHVECWQVRHPEKSITLPFSPSIVLKNDPDGKYSCIIQKKNKHVQCVFFNQPSSDEVTWEPRTTPLDIGPVFSIKINHHRACAVTKEKTVRCWSLHPGVNPRDPSQLISETIKPY